MSEKRLGENTHARRLPDSTKDSPDTGLGICGWILVYVSFFLTIITFPLSIWMCIKIVKEYERAIIFRLGRILQGGAKGPGLFFVLPCTDTFVKVDMRIISFDIPPQEILTKDSVTVSVEIKDVKLPVQLQRAMAAEAEASREARAKVIAAEGEMNASRALKEASIVISESPAALQLRYLQTLTTIAAEKNSTIVFPLPIDMLQGMMRGKQ
uniref:Stomatin n=1 Tax=Myotis myotis TaxID=51298 RepID=A0A7J7URD1_MYOMY|nr:stomatin [Myotis myotis]